MRKFAIAVILLIALGAAGTLGLRRELRRPYRGYSSAQVFVDIPRGSSRWGISGMLKENGVVRSRLAFELLSEWHRRSVLQAGEYRFAQAETPPQVFAEIAGGHIFMHTVVVPEGWTMFDIATELAKQGICDRDAFLKVARDPSLVRDIAPQAPSLEGFLFPATYEFTRHTSPEEIATVMVRHFREEWEKLQADDPAKNGPDKTVPKSHGPGRESGGVKGRTEEFEPLTADEIVTLASLVERETPQPKERPIVASVFYNRLKIGVPLQCDPTVQYALDLDGKPERDVTPEDLRVASPYNTYLHRGLPPGPIANPGDASLRAALHPAQTKYLYFVADTQGGHFFSRTLEEHNRNVERYRLLLQGASPQQALAETQPRPAPRKSVRRRTTRRVEPAAAKHHRKPAKPVHRG